VTYYVSCDDEYIGLVQLQFLQKNLSQLLWRITVKSAKRCIVGTGECRSELLCFRTSLCAIASVAHGRIIYW